MSKLLDDVKKVTTTKEKADIKVQEILKKLKKGKFKRHA